MSPIPKIDHLAELPSEHSVSLVRGQRQENYGHPLPNHERIAAFFTVRLRDKLKPGEVIDPHEAAAMMRLVKEARLMETPGHFDSLTDICGYADCEYLIHEELERRAAAVEEALANHPDPSGHPGGQART